MTLPGPFTSNGKSIKALSHGQWYTAATVSAERFTTEGRAEIADQIAAALNTAEAVAPMRAALQAISAAAPEIDPGEGEWSTITAAYLAGVAQGQYTAAAIARAALDGHQPPADPRDDAAGISPKE